jgi:hypothetical protein
MVYFVRFDIINDIGYLLGIREVPIVERKVSIRPVRICIDMVDPFGIESACPPDNAVDLITFVQKKFRQI